MIIRNTSTPASGDTQDDLSLIQHTNTRSDNLNREAASLGSTSVLLNSYLINFFDSCVSMKQTLLTTSSGCFPAGATA